MAKHQMMESAISPFAAGLKARCPRCGEGKLYAGMLNPAKECSACKLDYSFIDSGDGPSGICNLHSGLCHSWRCSNF